MSLPTFRSFHIGGQWDAERMICDTSTPLRIGYRDGRILAIRRARINGEWGNLRFSQSASWEEYMLYVMKLAEASVACKWLESEDAE